MAEMAEEGFVDVSKEQDGGLLKKILVEGKGEDTSSPGSSVDVHYVGTLHSVLEPSSLRLELARSSKVGIRAFSP